MRMNTSVSHEGKTVIVTLVVEGHKPGPSDIDIAVRAAWDTAMVSGENAVLAVVELDVAVHGETVRVILTGWE